MTAVRVVSNPSQSKKPHCDLQENVKSKPHNIYVGVISKENVGRSPLDRKKA